MTNIHSVQPILIIGAPRSGSKIFRETLRLHPDIVGPKYELERVWCYKNMDRYNMPLSVEQLTPDIITHIHNYFYRLAKKNPKKRIVAKSTLLPLRIQFLRTVFPTAPIIHILRDGRDSACSIRDRHRAPLEFSYLLKHRIFPPLSEVPYYLSNFLRYQFEVVVKRQTHVKCWGPQFDDMPELQNSHSLIEICGIQWNRSVMGIHEGLSMLKSGPFLQISYEELVSRPAVTLNRVLKYLRLAGDSDLIKRMLGGFRKGRIGRWRSDLSQDDIKLLLPHIREGMTVFGYL